VENVVPAEATEWVNSLQIKAQTADRAQIRKCQIAITQ